jgi:nitroimidazol reductase NimA-like FMN-containing flavoprotein (pyridoxamine 5'-phosphate oxidase superfamily)
MKPYKLPKMSSQEIDTLLKQQKICRIAFRGEEFPYLAPFQYVKIGDSLYFHFTDYGRKMRLIEMDNRVCIGIESFEPDMSEYRFVVLRGELERVKDEEERKEAIRGLAEIGQKGFSNNFVAAHGFSVKEGWDSLSESAPLVIYKLEKISRTIGLRSPSNNLQ